LSDALPGRTGFDLVHAYLDSDVEPVVDDLLTMDLTTIGCFDVVFYFGVLYHMVDPVGALRRLRQVTDGVAVIETAAIRVPTQPGVSLVEFYPGAELGGDYGNWFAPTGEALVGMCLAAGFRAAEVKAETPLVAPAPPPPERRRFRRSPEPPTPPLYDRTRLVAHAYA
jgi:tRNA (mo5U34)-methyltransferase